MFRVVGQFDENEGHSFDNRGKWTGDASAFRHVSKPRLHLQDRSWRHEFIVDLKVVWDLCICGSAGMVVTGNDCPSFG